MMVRLRHHFKCVHAAASTIVSKNQLQMGKIWREQKKKKNHNVQVFCLGCYTTSPYTQTSFSLENRSASATQTSWSNEKRSHNGTCSYTPEIHHCYQNCAVRNLMIQVRVQHCCGINLVNMQPVIRWITEYKGHLLIISIIIKVSHCNMQMITKK